MTPRLELNFPNPIETRSDLFGRDREFGLVQQLLLSPGRRPAVIMGERVTGKTSMLNVIAEWAADDAGLSVIQLPHVGSRNAFVEELLDGMAAEAGTSLHRLGLRDARGGLRAATMTEFVGVAAELCATAGATFLVCIDELDSMLVNCPDEDTAQQILDFLDHVIASTELPVKFAFTMTRTIQQILHSGGSPSMNAARVVFLVPWSAQQVRELVGALLGGDDTLDGPAHELLFAAGGGHPYLTKAVLQALQDLGRLAPGATATATTATATATTATATEAATTTTAADLRQAIEAAARSPEVDFTLDNIAQVHFSTEELGVLLRAATTGGAIAAADPAAPRDALDALCRRGYLLPDGAGGYVQAFGLLACWLAGKPWTHVTPEGPG